MKTLTADGQGVDHIIEVGGVGTLNQSLKAIRFEGVISVIGSVSGEPKPVPTILDCWTNTFTARGVAVGSRAMMEDMITAIEANNIHPVVDDQVFSLHETKNAFRHFVSVSIHLLDTWSSKFTDLTPEYAVRSQEFWEGGYYYRLIFCSKI